MSMIETAPAPPRTLYADLKPTAEQYALAIAKGAASEIAVFGARGDGKTWATLWAMVMHAIEHHQAGYALPTIWLGVRDTFANHRLSTHKILYEAAWAGAWELSDGGHVATFHVDRLELVKVDLVGVDSPSDAERVRTHCHCLWVEEPAPAYELSGGISKGLYSIALSSRILETHARVAALSSNAPDLDDWVWQRFVAAPQPGTMYFRIPKGERATEKYREELQAAYADNPSLYRRLVDGEPGMVVLGELVAVGFEASRHAPYGWRAEPDPTATVWVGQDGGLTPTSVIGQRRGGSVHVLGSVTSAHDGMQEHVRGVLRPWLAEHVPWALQTREALQIVYDPSMNKDGEGNTESNALRIMQRELPGVYRAGPVNWQPRVQPLLSLLTRHEGLLIDPVHARGLVKALGGGWHYPTGPDGKVRRDDPVKNHPHSDYGDALLYLLAGMAPGKEPRDPRRYQVPARMTFSPYSYDRAPVGRRASVTAFSPYGSWGR